jgi:hypothetical protein
MTENFRSIEVKGIYYLLKFFVTIMITTWNDHLGRLKFFFRWLYNYKIKKDEDSKLVEASSHIF